MKFLRSLLLLPALIIIGKVQAQTCIPSVIIFTTQQQVDNFPSDYPGCSVVQGNIGITGNDITNLDSLIFITEIQGSMQIGGSVSDISGFSNLIKIGGSVINNLSSAPFEFPSLVVIGGNFNTLGFNSTYLFPSLDSLKGDLTVYHLGSSAPDINFNDLDFVNDVTLRGNIADYNVFASLDTIFGNLDIDENQLSVSINGFQTTQVVQGAISIFHNTQITGINGFNALLTCNGLTVHHNNQLTSVSGFNS